jgi:hypothetical protein
MFCLASNNEVTKPKAAPVVDGLAQGGWANIAMGAWRTVTRRSLRLELNVPAIPRNTRRFIGGRCLLRPGRRTLHCHCHGLGGRRVIEPHAKRRRDMPQWMIAVMLALMVVAAGSSAYTAFKVYQMTDGRLVPSKTKR